MFVAALEEFAEYSVSGHCKNSATVRVIGKNNILLLVRSAGLSLSAELARKAAVLSRVCVALRSSEF